MSQNFGRISPNQREQYEGLSRKPSTILNQKNQPAIKDLQPNIESSSRKNKIKRQITKMKETN